ncbi:MAG: hypothetical protein ACTHK4_18135 [Mycobacteriales bacterium]
MTVTMVANEATTKAINNSPVTTRQVLRSAPRTASDAGAAAFGSPIDLLASDGGVGIGSGSGRGCGIGRSGLTTLRGRGIAARTSAGVAGLRGIVAVLRRTRGCTITTRGVEVVRRTLGASCWSWCPP